MLIYPSVVRRAALPPDVDWKPAVLPHIVEQEERVPAAREGPHARQYAYLRKRIPITSKVLPIHLSGSSQRLTTGVVTSRIRLYGSYFEDGLTDLEVIAPDEVSVVNLSQLRTMVFGIHHKTDESTYWLREWVFPKEFGGKLTVQQYSNYKPVLGATYTIDVPPTSIIADSALKAGKT